MTVAVAISGNHTDDMVARVFIIIAVHALSNCVTNGVTCVTVNLYDPPEIISKSKVELTPIIVTGGLNDIVVLSAPILNAQAIYYLHKPNGDAFRLNLKNKTDNALSNRINEPQFRIFNVNDNESKTTDVVAIAEAEMTPYEFMIGPLQEDDYGNWVLSAYFEDIDGHWTEFFQVITMEIIEQVQLFPEKPELNIGDQFILSFIYPIRGLQSCQLIPPQSTIDRYFDRTKTGLDRCQFIIKNVSTTDEGTWTIVGVGPIVYKGSSVLHVRD